MPAAQSALNVAVRRCLTAICSWQISEPPHSPRIRGPEVKRQRWLSRRASQEVACEGHGTRGQGPGGGGRKKRARMSTRYRTFQKLGHLTSSPTSPSPPRTEVVDACVLWILCTRERTEGT
jgi:hypothetical protein